MNIPPPILLGLQRLLDSIVDTQSGLREQLSVLAGRVVRIECTLPPVNIVLLFDDERIDVAGEFDAPVDVTLRGSAAQLFSMLNNSDALFNGDVTVTGDATVAASMKHVLARAGIDWEEHLSAYIGDTPAHQLGRLHRGMSGWLSRSHDRLAENTGDFIQYETELVAPNSEVARFCQSVDDLRLMLDRLESRITSLERACNTDARPH